ncbi:hypothetical protein [Sinomicrobium soli]|uniref:hypothetical protein n=1 Tax=Sinomicrobium sp. N-1-3-6 TaxID=2219864 RepID=UPI000DCCD8DE|nr:hypothetical protein [Sinomicrobium sp. N-1-3-6]RAV31002.1 hypothetical protein DN748_01785 [Sinomicrobium sp. N-1-3-6]
MAKRFRMFAGPNGSGKSSLIEQISDDFNMGYFVNADNVKTSFKNHGFLDCNEYLPRQVSDQEWNTFILNCDLENRLGTSYFPPIRLKENIMVAEDDINSYHAALICEFFRIILLRCTSGFSFETVMSHPSKVSFLRHARSSGFKTYLYFICTQDPEINKSRVYIRHRKGGHYVSDEKIESRYYRSLELLSSAFMEADRAYVLDSSSKNRDVVLEKSGQEVSVYSDTIPEWVDKYLVKKLSFK